MKIGFYISGRGIRLRKIFEEFSMESIKEIQFVISDKSNENMKSFLNKKFNNVKYIEYYNSEINKNFSDWLLNICEEYCIDYLFVFGNEILKGEILKKYENRLINFHPSLLPNYKGLNAVQRAVDDKMSLLGNTAHFITKEIDGGAIILQNVVSSEIYNLNGIDGVLDCQVELFFKLYDLLKNNRVSVKNNKVIIDGADYKYSSIFPHIE